MNLQQFKYEAERRGNFYDNSEAAGRAWAASWGLTWWRSVWFYKEYKVGGMVYRSGMWRGRWGGHTVTECEIDGQQVSKYRFEKALATFEAPAITDDDRARLKALQEARQTKLMEKAERDRQRRNDRARARRARATADDSRQLTLAFS